MSLSQDEVRDLRAGNLIVDALHMELTRAGAVVYKGPGQIRQTDDGSIEYVLYDANAEEGWGRDSPPLSGSWVGPERFLELKVRDWQGRNWTSPETEPNTSHVRGSRGVVCHGRVNEITLEVKSYIKTGEFLSLYLPGDIDIPSNLATQVTSDSGGRRSFRTVRNVWKIDGPEYSIRIVRVDDGLEIEATQQAGAFPEHFDLRLLESLWFVLARPVDWQIRRHITAEADRLTIVPRLSLLESPRLNPPLFFRKNGRLAVGLGEMLLKYLDYITTYSEARYHPTSVNIRQTLLASATNIQTEALALGIGVESFIRREYEGLGIPDDETLAGIVAALAYLEQWKGPPKLKERVCGAVSGMKGSSPRSAMNKLLKSGVFTDEQHKAWIKIRNTTAHGMDLIDDPVQVVQWCDQTHLMLLRLIFSRIGYRGPYTDYATVGWGELQYPQ